MKVRDQLQPGWACLRSHRYSFETSWWESTACFPRQHLSWREGDAGQNGACLAAGGHGAGQRGPSGLRLLFFFPFPFNLNILFWPVYLSVKIIREKIIHAHRLNPCCNSNCFLMQGCCPSAASRAPSLPCPSVPILHNLSSGITAIIPN